MTRTTSIGITRWRKRLSSISTAMKAPYIDEGPQWIISGMLRAVIQRTHIIAN